MVVLPDGTTIGTPRMHIAASRMLISSNGTVVWAAVMVVPMAVCYTTRTRMASLARLSIGTDAGRLLAEGMEVAWALSGLLAMV